MPWLGLYVDDDDANLLLERLNQDSDISFIVRDAPGRLVAKPTLGSLPRGRQYLWHTPSGPVPHVRLKKGLLGMKQIEDVVVDPWTGWEETVTSAEGEPWFGPGAFGMLVLTYHPLAFEQAEGIGVSGFEWIGSRYAKAPAVTTEWWKQLRTWSGKVGRRISSSGSIESSPKDKFAFPSALSRIRGGAWRDRNPHHVFSPNVVV